MDQDAMKRKVGERAAEHIDRFLEKDSIVGVGTGSTANCFIDALAGIKTHFDGAVASSVETERRLKEHGIPVYDLNGVKRLAWYVDGADEVDPWLHAIKGGGGALTREKIVASVAEQFICIVDESKCVDLLGNFPLPVEVIPMARSAVGRALVELGGRPVYREGFTTDNGNLILDVHGLTITDPRKLESDINNIVGVVTNGLFAARGADLLLVATPGGVDERRAKS